MPGSDLCLNLDTMSDQAIIGLETLVMSWQHYKLDPDQSSFVSLDVIWEEGQESVATEGM